jgi:hypothetical protein
MYRLTILTRCCSSARTPVSPTESSHCSSANSEVAAFYVSLLESPLPDSVDRDAYIADLVTRTKEFVKWIDTDPELTDGDWIMVLRCFAEIGPDDIDTADVEDDLGVDLSESRQDRRASIPAEVSSLIFAGDPSAFLKVLVSKALSARSLFSLIQELCWNEQIMFEVVQHELNAELNRTIQQLEREEAEHKRLAELLIELETQIDELETEDIEVKPFDCDKCQQKLDLPYVGLFCGHKVHRACCEEVEEADIGCPLCQLAATPVYSAADLNRTLELQQGNPYLLDSVVTMVQNGYFS